MNKEGRMYLMIIIYLIIFLLILYTVIPFVFSRWLGAGVCLSGGEAAVQKCEIAFTFDDGPNPTYTMELLDLLKQHHIKATFFVVGKNAEKHPEIIERMHHDGHLIGLHNYIHSSNWLMPPWKVKQGLDKSVRIIEEITGSKPIYYRPPWGMLNLFDYFIHKDFKIILWSLMVGDWRSEGGSKKIEERLLKGIKAGDIILLHDAGENWGANKDAPHFTIEALKHVLNELSNKGYHYVRLDEWI